MAAPERTTLGLFAREMTTAANPTANAAIADHFAFAAHFIKDRTKRLKG